MPTPGDPSPSLPPESLLIQEVITTFDAYARIRKAGDGILTAVRYSSGDEERAFDDLQRAVTRLRTSSR